MRDPKSEIQICSDNSQLICTAADYVLHHTAEAIKNHGSASIALAGGSTPKALYALLASTPYRELLDWTRIHVFWGDERHVPADHPESNYRMAQEAMLSKVPIPPAQIYRIEGERSKAEDAAEVYEKLLVTHFHVPPQHVPRFDLVLLGLGPDGHTASLFPGTSTVHENSRWVMAPWVEKLKTHRITMTPVLLNHAAHIAFLVSGPDKSPALAAVLEGPFRPDEYPAQMIQPRDGTITWFLDRAASRELQSQI